MLPPCKPHVQSRDWRHIVRKILFAPLILPDDTTTKRVWYQRGLRLPHLWEDCRLFLHRCNSESHVRWSHIWSSQMWVGLTIMFVDHRWVSKNYWSGDHTTLPGKFSGSKSSTTFLSQLEVKVTIKSMQVAKRHCLRIVSARILTLYWTWLH